MRTYDIAFLDDESTILQREDRTYDTYTLKAENPWALLRILGLDFRQQLETAASLSIELVS